MKIRLKDRALQRKLDEISGGDFTKSLEVFDYLGEKDGIFCTFGKAIDDLPMTLFSARFRKDELEEDREYDPAGWNVWPEVEPPRDVSLRIEVREPDEDLDTPEPRFGKIRKKACACFDGLDWYFWPGEPFGARIYIEKGEIVRFRPWVGPGEETVG